MHPTDAPAAAQVTPSAVNVNCVAGASPAPTGLTVIRLPSGGWDCVGVGDVDDLITVGLFPLHGDYITRVIDPAMGAATAGVRLTLGMNIFGHRFISPIVIHQDGMLKHWRTYEIPIRLVNQ